VQEISLLHSVPKQLNSEAWSLAKIDHSLGFLSEGDDLLSGVLTGTPDLVGDKALGLTFLDTSLDGGLDVGQMGLVGEEKVLLEGAVGVHEGELTIVFLDGEASDLDLLDDGSGDHITSTEGLIVLLVCEDVLGGDHGFGGSVLTGLGSGEGGDSAGELLLHDDEGAGLHAASISQLGVVGT